jgi:hypothetical protein
LTAFGIGFLATRIPLPRIDTRDNPKQFSSMTAAAMLELKQRVSRLTKSEQRALMAYLDRPRRASPRRKPTRVKMQRDPVTGLPCFSPKPGTPPLSLTDVKRAMRYFP